mmetsp:Transcript_14200/g.59408  ORF Transcript_14200/g.59408 Transcript_14200/m.59408 type:complete len:229 (+) Transcript_14200:844-1530(+)
MALRLSPPPSESRRACASPPAAAIATPAQSAARSKALARSSPMLSPEWPPRQPLTDTFSAAAAANGSVATARFRMLSPPPAQPMYTLPHSSVSRLSIVVAVRSLSASRPNAPVSPVSSSTVKSASSGGSGASASESRSASAAATPMPLSAPSVVPTAVTQSPSRTTFSGVVSKSKPSEGSASVTMSTCPWTHTAGASSPPPLPGRAMTRLPTASLRVSSPRSRANSRR